MPPPPAPRSSIPRALLAERERFLAFLAARLGSRAEAEEVLQAAYLKGMRASRGLRAEEKVEAWFFRILKNALADHWRRKSAEKRALERRGREDQRLGSLAERALDRRVCSCVKRLVDTIKPEYAEAIREVDLAERPVKDFARERGVSENSASVRLHRARKSLREKVLHACGSCAHDGCADCDCGSV